MPSIRGFSVTVEDNNGTAFREYGNRKRGNIVFTSIEAKDKVRFQIRVRPDCPFPVPNDDGHSLGKSRYDLRSAKPDEMDCDESKSKPKKAFDYFAYVYIDGNAKREDCLLIDTDPGSETFCPEGDVFKGRCSEVAKADDPFSGSRSDSDTQTTFRISPWMFQDKGIDFWLAQKMDLSKDNGELPKNDLDQDVADITEALVDDNLSKSGNTKRGRIEVIVKREVEEGMCDPWENSKQDSREKSENGDNNTHEVIVDQDDKDFCQSRAVWARPYRPDEQFYCKFVFEYHDLAKLKVLQLCDRHGNPLSRHRQRMIAMSTDPEPDTRVLKRSRDLDISKSDHIAGENMMSDDESASSDSTSDSDVPRPRKRRLNSVAHKNKPRKKQGRLTWRSQKAVEASKSSEHLSGFDFDFNDDTSRQVQLKLQAASEQPESSNNQIQLAIADTETGMDTFASGNELILSGNEIVQMTEGEDTF